eukprot:scaffold138236_cov50-Prasinocladus_malaysianus.AAC.1
MSSGLKFRDRRMELFSACWAPIKLQGSFHHDYDPGNGGVGTIRSNSLVVYLSYMILHNTKYHQALL